MNDRLRKYARQALRRHRARSGDDLTGFVEDVDHYLWQTDQFTSIDVRKTGNPHCAILATCRFSRDRSTEEIGRLLETVWVNDLRYGRNVIDGEWHEVSVDAGRVTLAFVTASGLCVTGEIVAEREEEV